VTKERAEQLLFTEGYLDTDFQFLIKKGAKDIKQLEDIKGMTISVNKGSAYDSWGRDNMAKYGFKLESYGTNTDAVQAVLAGRADANLAGNTVVAWAAKQNPQLQLSYTIKTGLVWSIPFRKDDVETRNKVEDVVECMKLDGTYARLSERWFGVKPELGSAAVTVFAGYGVPGMAGYVPEKPAPKCG
jgi:polar amino acid transport system substrate-binding protein